MARQTKVSFGFYSAWNYQKEIEDLNKASDEGWQLVRGGCFHSRFVKNPHVRYRYQLDFGKIEDMGRYIETFREQGWEYINSTFNGWHYLRKLYDPSLPEEEYEIFTDSESLQEMNTRWARIATALGIILALFAVLFAVRMVMRPKLPGLVQMLTLAVESMVLLRGAKIMRDPEASRSRKGDSAWLGLFFAVIIIGAAAGIILSDLRPYLSTSQNTDSVEEPIVDNRWTDITVSYPDWYYFDLGIKAEKPLTFAVISEAGETVYTVTETDLEEDDIRVRLGRGKYWLSMSCESGFELDCEID